MSAAHSIESLRRRTKVGETGCWEWQGAKDRKGYGQVMIARKVVRTHRLMWQLAVGLIPAGLCVLHRCDCPPCCNPDHLFLGTDADNVADRVAKGRSATGVRSGRYTRPESTPRGDRHGRHTKPERNPIGQRNGRAKLTNEQAKEIKSRYRRETYHKTNAAELAKEFGVSPLTVTRIACGRAYGKI